jgi:hypothetical protein
MRYLKKVKGAVDPSILEQYGREGVAALASATPVATGLTASSWYYKVEREGKKIKLVFCNSNVQNGVQIAVIIQLGHGTGTGGWVEGRDYINPAIQPLFDKMANDVWREVTNS